MYKDIFSKRLYAFAPMIATIRKSGTGQLSGGQLPGPLPAGTIAQGGAA